LNKTASIGKVSLLNNDGHPESALSADGNWNIQLPAYGLKVIEIEYK
jgi:hypothetical protein